jgi:hypothetical protein
MNQTNKQRVVRSFKAPVGKYWLGDPCYAIEDQDTWLDLLKSCNYFEDGCVGFTDGAIVGAFHTLAGDGLYEDDEGFVYSVDSGLIGLVHETYVQVRFTPEEAALGRGRWIEFTGPGLTQCYSDGRGCLTFGSINIETA